MISDIKKYYSKRSDEYDKSMYQKDEPIRIAEIKQMTKIVEKIFKNKDILEIACGTGYWTQIASKNSRSILATDAVKEVILEAKKKKYYSEVNFKIADAFNLNLENQRFNAGLAGFWFSHMLKRNIPLFLKEFHKYLKSNSIVFLSDNVLSSDPFENSLISENENTFRTRELNQKTYKVIKNYFTKQDLIKYFSPFAKDSKVNVTMGEWAWWATYETK